MHKNVRHYLFMRINAFTAVAVGVAIALVNPYSAVADAKPTPSSSPVSDFQNALNQYKVDLQQYLILLSNREQSKKLITQEFIFAVTSANGAAQSALRTAKTADAKTAVAEQLKTSIRIASSTRDAANTALGPIPLEPIKPVKSQEIAPLKKTKP